jgi:hypothetical protein
MTDDEKFREVKYSESEPDGIVQAVVTNLVGYKPWLLIVADSSQHGDLSLLMEAGGGLTIDLIPHLLEKSLIAFKQGNEEPSSSEDS